jgi:membrane protein
MAVLKVLHGGSALSGTALVTGAQIRAHTRIGYDEMTLLLEQMVAVGWVGRVHAEDTAQVLWGRGAREGGEGWVLLVDPASIRLSDVYRLFVFGGVGVDGAPAGPVSAAGIVEPASPSPLALDTAGLARQVEAAVEAGLNQTLAEHFAHATS